jgi:DNA-binding transcriptional LysR family regulator
VSRAILPRIAASTRYPRGPADPVARTWWPSFPGFHLYYSSRMLVARKLRAFIDFMQARLS